ncbi:retrotransposable element [Paramuricea clavata]|uniref:Retrotransposable element n=1 Tax=Paramuricea clavata TaxID=317549 RepID=A0A6S7FNZ4_PARCT|nr:retrotransposable element [Paramuricea clavata]
MEKSRVDGKLGKQHAELHPIPVSDVWKQVGIDLIGPLKTSKQGNSYIATMTDYFSKWPEAQAIPNKSAKCVSDFLFKMILRYRCMDIVISDQGREFVNQVNNELFARTGVDHCITSVYHPQTNGLTERFNQTLVNAIVRIINEDQDNWEDNLDSILFCYRSSKNNSTNFSPFFLMYGREPKLPIELAVEGSPRCDNQDSTQVSLDTKVEQLLKLKKSVHDLAMENIRKAQDRQKRNYDKKHDSTKLLKVGNLVLVKNMHNLDRKGWKMDTRWLRPYMITAHIGKGRYKLLSQESGKHLAKMINSSRLKKYIRRNPDEKSTETQTKEKIIIPDVPKEDTRADQNNNKWIKALGLKKSDRIDILKKRMLNDRIVNGAQKLSKKKFALVGGLQDPLLSQISFDRCTSKGVQIHNTGKIYWITSSSIGGQPVSVYDSLYDDLTESSEKQLAQCYHNCINQAGQLHIEMASFQKQKGSTDCGLFAIASAYELGSGNIHFNY